jgi:hypothetical protein
VPGLDRADVFDKEAGTSKEFMCLVGRKATIAHNELSRKRALAAGKLRNGKLSS